MNIMLIAIICGLTTSIFLETIILFKDLGLKKAFKTALGMSLISMIGMEIAMNSVDFILNGEPIINLRTIIPVLLAGFILPLPYNYWRLKKYGVSCH
jgi:putative flippase GtrA